VYSSLAFDTLGRIVEIVSGRPFDRFLDRAPICAVGDDSQANAHLRLHSLTT
jgi:hypothetical protein